MPLDWALAQNNLGTALQILGQRESGTGRQEQAVAAYRAALQERTRERVPIQWATTQNNLGLSLWVLGERESGTERLEEAVAAFRAALQEFTRERVPLQWAMAQNNLGNALQVMGERESGTARLQEAVAAYRAALQEYTAMPHRSFGSQRRKILIVHRRPLQSVTRIAVAGRDLAAYLSLTEQRAPPRAATQPRTLHTRRSRAWHAPDLTKASRRSKMGAE